LHIPVGATVRQRVTEALAGIAERETARILLAVESGSRAWGFPSRDSDYDIRFIYLRPVADYLSVFPSRDVIECPREGDLDIGGWDLRKALALLVRSNAVLLEWLSSPIVYASDPDASHQLARLARAEAHLPTLEYHYDRLVRGHWPANEATLGVKSLCYALRPALALRWLRDFRAPPPMDLPSLVAGLKLADGFRDAVESLRERKATGRESDPVRADGAIAALLNSTLATRPARPGARDRSRAAAAVDRLFRGLLPGATPGGPHQHAAELAMPAATSSARDSA
jgi:predicted nucleotidyltransferase